VVDAKAAASLTHLSQKMEAHCMANNQKALVPVNASAPRGFALPE
jgi:hypothetical protein